MSTTEGSTSTSEGSASTTSVMASIASTLTSAISTINTTASSLLESVSTVAWTTSDNTTCTNTHTATKPTSRIEQTTMETSQSIVEETNCSTSSPMESYTIDSHGLWNRRISNSGVPIQREIEDIQNTTSNDNPILEALEQIKASISHHMTITNARFSSLTASIDEKLTCHKRLIEGTMRSMLAAHELHYREEMQVLRHQMGDRTPTQTIGRHRTQDPSQTRRVSFANPETHTGRRFQDTTHDISGMGQPALRSSSFGGTQPRVSDFGLSDQGSRIGRSRTLDASWGAPRMTLPTFNGAATSRPMRYLQELKQYCLTLGLEQDIKLVISQSMTGSTKEWWLLIEEKIYAWEDFEREFKRRFWNEEEQYRISEKLEFGSFDENKKGSRVDYAIRIISNAKDIEPPIPEAQIITKMARHFDENIRSAILARGMKTTDEILDLLQRFDKIGPVNSRRDYQNRYPKTDRENQQRYPSKNEEKTGANSQRRDDSRQEKPQQGQPRAQTSGYSAPRNQQNRQFSQQQNVRKIQGKTSQDTTQPGNAEELCPSTVLQNQGTQLEYEQ
ncbi:uncharacterized protein LOC112495244 [Cephus cinctus]|uniref:Uncharacterized protein LOC112495244 n=1 Tax=Cephus cinctus TaxID=211228 RepID=A0AAJ7RTC1_CEPCN|nr:uncharacterized protein LOC112495244 [Cephus cinctus]